MAKSQNDRAIIDLVINGQQAKTSLKEVSLAVTATTSALMKMKEADDPAAYRAKVAEVQKLILAQRQMRAEIFSTTTAWSRFKSQAGAVTAGIIGGNAVQLAVQAVTGSISKAITSYREFNAASADMSANLGLSAKDVEYFNAKAQEMGPAMGKSGAEMLDAFKLVGSANSDLIKTPELLADVTAKSVTLSQASKMNLADATASLVGSMNQFDAGAEEAERYINVMAGGAQVGSAEIADMAASLKASGLVAHTAGLSFEETNGALQSLSKEGLKGEQAGTMFRNFLTTLASGADETNPKVVGLQTALDNLGKKNMGVTELTKMFGRENLTAALSLINHRDRVAEFTQGLTGTTAAYDMAAKNNATFDHQLELLGAQVDKVALWLGSKLVPALTSVVSGVMSAITALPQLYTWLKKNGEWLLITGIPALVLYNAALIKATLTSTANAIAEGYSTAVRKAGAVVTALQTAATSAYSLITGVLTGRIQAAAAMQVIWNAVMALNPIGLVVTALAALVAGIKYFSEHTERAIDVERKMNSLRNQGKLATELNSRALQDLTSQMGHYNELSKTEQENLKKTIALKQQEARARLQAALAKAREVAREAAEPNFWQGVKSGATSLVTGQWGNLAGSGLEQQKKEQTEANKAAAYAEAKRQANVEQLQNDLAGFDKLLQQPTKTTTTTGGGGKGGQSDEQKKAAEQKKKQALADAEDLEKLLADSRKRIAGGEESDYDKEVAAFADKYTRMYELAKDNQAKIEEIQRLSLLEFSDIDKKRQEKEDEEARKKEKEDNKTGFDAAMNVADQTRSDAQGAIELGQAQNPQKAGDAEVQMQKLQADQAYLAQKLLLEQTFAQESADTQRQLTENWNEQVKLRAQTEHQYAEQMKQAEWALQDAKRSAMAQGIGILQGFLKQGTLAYKAAIIAQKAYAIAQVFVDMNREIAQIYANPTWSLMPDGGLALKTAAATGAKIRAGISIASIAASGIGELAAKADGGYTGLQELYGGSPAGFVDGPTLFNQGRRSYIAGEAGREFVISNRALQNPVVADFARMMDVAQKTGNYGALQTAAANAGGSAASTGGSQAIVGGAAGGGASSDLLMMMVKEQQLTRSALEKFAQRGVSLDLFALERKQAEIASIRQTTGL